MLGMHRPIHPYPSCARQQVPTISSLLVVLGVLGTGVGLSVLEATAEPTDPAADDDRSLGGSIDSAGTFRG